MGYYFREAKTTADLTVEQQERYTALRSPTAEIPAVLLARLRAIKERIGPVTSGEVWSALEELVQDAIVLWILSEENPAIEWVDLEVYKEEISEEERTRRREAWDKLQKEWAESAERQEREGRAWLKENEPVRYYLLRFLELLDGFLSHFRKRNRN